MTDVQAKGDRRARRIRAMLWTVVVMVAGSMLLPFAGFLYTAVVQADDTAVVNPRSETWREARDGTAGRTTVIGQETNVLIQSAGETWREIRNGPVITLGGIMVVGMILALAVFHLVKGGAKLEHRTGKTVLRWPAFDRVLHWYTAVLFIVLAVTGLSLLWGRVFIDLFESDGFKAAFAAWAG